MVKGIDVAGTELWSEEAILADFRIYMEDTIMVQNKIIVNQFFDIGFYETPPVSGEEIDYQDIVSELRFSIICSDPNVPKQFCFDELVCEVQHGDEYNGLNPP